LGIGRDVLGFKGWSFGLMVPRFRFKVLAVRPCVLIKPRPISFFPDRFVWAFSHKGLSEIWGRLFFSERLSPFFFWI